MKYKTHKQLARLSFTQSYDIKTAADQILILPVYFGLFLYLLPKTTTSIKNQFHNMLFGNYDSV